MASTTKRVRGSNFSKEEQLMLVEEIGRFKNIIENKATNKVSCNEKQEAWKRVEAGFNSKAVSKRTLLQLQAKYENLKTEARKLLASEKIGIRGTGGGPFKGVKDDPVLLALLEIINPKTVVGLSNIFDSDGANIGILHNERTEIIEAPHVPPESLELEQSERQLTSELLPGIISHLEPMTSQSQFSLTNLTPLRAEDEMMDSDNIMISLLEPKAAQCSSTRFTPETKRKMITENEIMDSDNWSNYTPQKLKKSVNQKLRPKICHPVVDAKEEYYKKKAALAEKQKEILEEKEKRDKEEHEKKMELLDLQIRKLKEANENS